jgi:single-strand DNA-binding protein
MIKLQLIGKLAKDATAKQVGESFIVEMSVPVNEKYKSKGEMVEKTTWVRANYWVKSDKIVAYLKKGTTVFVEGKPVVETYTNKDGEVKVSFDVIVNNLEFFNLKPETDATDTIAEASPRDESDLPF